LASICENRSCKAADRLVGADVVVADVLVADDDWLCAASSACIVAGEICEGAPNPVVTGPVFVAVEAGLEIWNGWPKPVDCVEEEADAASA
jgi:hypothetical protein